MKEHHHSSENSIEDGEASIQGWILEIKQIYLISTFINIECFHQSSHLLILCYGPTNKAGKSQGQNYQKSPLTNCGRCLLNLDWIKITILKDFFITITLLVPFSAGYSSAAPAASIRVNVATVSMMMGMY